MSFYIYSYPAVDEVNIEKIGQKQNKFEKLKNYNILKSTLLYTEFDNAVGVEGYEILIESEVLEIDDFHAYLIIAKNHLGESKYRFEIIDQENLPLAKGKRIIFVIVCCIASILLVYLTITHVCVCVKHVKIRNQRQQNLQEDHIYHTYDEIGTLSFRAVSSLHSADIIDNLGQNPTGEHTHNVSVDVNLQSTTDYTTELNAGFLNDGLQREITDVHGQGRSISLLDTNFSNTDVSPISFTGISRIKNVANCNQTSRNTDRSREQKNKTCKTCNNSRSWSSNDVMVGNVKNEYENNYQLQDGHQYLETIDDRQFKISATDYSTNNHQKRQTSNDSRPSNNAMVGQARNEYENNYQLQDGNLYFETIDNGQISISSTMDSIVKIQQRSQTISDASSGSSDKYRVGNVRNEYENKYQLQDGHMYPDILDDRPITLSSTDSIAKIHQRSQTISDAASESTNNAMVGNERNEYENNNRMQDGHLYLDIIHDRPNNLSSTDSIAKNHQRSQTMSDAGSESSNNAMVGNERNEYENNYQLQDGRLYLDILDDRPITLSSTDSIAKIHQRSQTISDAGSESSNNAMVGNEINEYENNYQLQDSHMYLDILDDRKITISSSDSIEKNQQRSQTISDGDGGSSNNSMLCNERNEYENNYQLQDIHLCLDILNERNITVSSSDSIEKYQHRSQTISDADGGTSNNSMLGNERNEYENNYQLQDGHLYLAVLGDRHISISATDSSTNKQQQSQPSDDSDSGSSNNVMVDYYGDGYENPYQMILQDHTESNPYTEIIKDRHSGTSSTESDKPEEQEVQPGSAKE
ncbi:Hypothetical predicted protein [Mytilus galloprovincialis]|uniref:Uncharacterized protein n=1 Tax=Mytilus galloprovincialis TaxID=29158 RepID=A0A8B6G708_MYTGA|nr:Hypothetical predicted protein [Mytilus galloprovincialis]